MTTRESLLKYVDYKQSKGFGNPIFQIMLFKNSNKEMIYNTGKHSGFPNLGCTDYPGFYYNLDDAIEAMHCNSCDMKETVYNAGFILCHFEGMYNNSAGTEGRMYFVWNNEKQGFFQQEEPKVFAHVAY